MEQTRSLFCMCDLSITTPVSLLANEFNVRCELHTRVSLAAGNQIYVIHEAMNGCKNLKIHERLALKFKYVHKLGVKTSYNGLKISYYCICLNKLKDDIFAVA